MRSIRFSSATDIAWKIFQHFPSLIMSLLFMEETDWSKKSWLMINIHWPQMQTMQKICSMMLNAMHTKLFWMSWQTKRANCSLCMVMVEPAKHLFRQHFCPVYEGRQNRACSCLIRNYIFVISGGQNRPFKIQDSNWSAWWVDLQHHTTYESGWIGA